MLICSFGRRKFVEIKGFRLFWTAVFIPAQPLGAGILPNDVISTSGYFQHDNAVV